MHVSTGLEGKSHETQKWKTFQPSSCHSLFFFCSLSTSDSFCFIFFISLSFFFPALGKFWLFLCSTLNPIKVNAANKPGQIPVLWNCCFPLIKRLSLLKKHHRGCVIVRYNIAESDVHVLFVSCSPSWLPFLFPRLPPFTQLRLLAFPASVRTLLFQAASLLLNIVRLYQRVLVTGAYLLNVFRMNTVRKSRAVHIISINPSPPKSIHLIIPLLFLVDGSSEHHDIH